MLPNKPIAPPLLEWYYENRRILPFREDPTPYHIWVSEIMLQQTRVAAALPYYHRFIARLPGVQALAEVDGDTLHKLWEGLGYYSRVRNMQKAARVVMETCGGVMPTTYEGLLALPGIGEYTAGAIASIAYGLPVVAVDGNVLRVYSRLLADEGDIMKPAVKKRLGAVAQAEQPPEKAGDYNQALMELGALVCTPKSPLCTACPLLGRCEAARLGIAATLPFKAPKKPKEEVELTVVILHSGAGVYVEKRPESGLLAGLWQPLLLEGRPTEDEISRLLEHRFGPVALQGPLPDAKHIFTHKIWHMAAFSATVACAPPLPAGAAWANAAELQGIYTVPSAFKAYQPYMEGAF